MYTRRPFTTKVTYMGWATEPLPQQQTDMLAMVEDAYNKVNEIIIKQAKEEAKKIPSGGSLQITLHKVGDSVNVTEHGHNGLVQDSYTATRPKQ